MELGDLACNDVAGMGPRMLELKGPRFHEPHLSGVFSLSTCPAAGPGLALGTWLGLQRNSQTPGAGLLGKEAVSIQLNSGTDWMREAGTSLGAWCGQASWRERMDGL